MTNKIDQDLIERYREAAGEISGDMDSAIEAVETNKENLEEITDNIEKNLAEARQLLEDNIGLVEKAKEEKKDLYESMSNAGDIRTDAESNDLDESDFADKMGEIETAEQEAKNAIDVADQLIDRAERAQKEAVSLLSA